jgi:hypothetical protein
VARLILATGDSGLERIGERRDGHKQAMARYRPAHAAPARDGETEDMLPTRRMQWPPTLHRVNRRPFGVGPVPLLSAGLGAAAILAIILFALGSWVAGVVVLACGLGCLALLLVAVEHEPNDPAARLAVSAAERARSQTRLLGVAARAWSRAGLVVLRVRHRRYRLRWRLRRQLTPLGEAAYRGDAERLEMLKAQAQQIEAALRDADRDGARAVGAARAEVDRERQVAQPTEVLPVDRGE